LSEGFYKVLEEILKQHEDIGLVITNKYPWIIPTVIGRIYEEYSIPVYIVLTDPYVIEHVRSGLQHIKDYNVAVIADYDHGAPLLSDDVFDTALRMNRLFKILAESARGRIVVDVTGCDGSTAATVMYFATRILGDRAIYTLVENIPLYGIPAYPGSPRWLHKLYVYGSKRVDAVNTAGGVREASYPKVIEWRGTRGIYIAFSKLFNTLTVPGYCEYFYENKRELVKSGGYIEVYSHSNTSFDVKQKLLVINEVTGPDEVTSRMLYDSWRVISDILACDYRDKDKQIIDRIVMQIQRYTGAADLVVRGVAGSNSGGEWAGEKLHRVLVKLADEKQHLALVPDTNLFYQGIHMVLLKASIRSGVPWSKIKGVTVYIPKCAETEINGKVAEINADTDGLAKLSYMMALLANRAILETKYYYGAEVLNATAQPCEVAVAVEASSLPEHRVLLITADHKAFNAWQTLNICRNKITCMYIGHSDEPLELSSIYGRFYASISIAQLIYVASLFTPITIKSARDTIKITVKTLKGATAPAVSITRVKGEQAAQQALSS